MMGNSRDLLRLCRRVCYRTLPLSAYLKLMYFVYFRKLPNLKNPQKFSEKMYCMKIHNAKNKQLFQQCYDKYRVREYIIEKLGKEQGEKILNSVYGVYERSADIDFETLPTSFALKVTQGSGPNILCPSKESLDWRFASCRIDKWLKEANATPGSHEESYSFDGHARLVCEKYLQDKDGEVPPDIRVYCFHGEPKLFVCDFGTTERNGEHGDHIVRNVYDTEWNLLNVDLGRPHDARISMPRPDNIEEIRRVAEKLSEDFDFVRVDLYNLEGRVIFGELTWIPMGGNCLILPESFDYLLGSWLDVAGVDKQSRKGHTSCAIQS